MGHCMRCASPASCDVWGCVPGTFRSEKYDPDPQPLTPGQQKILDAVPLRKPGPFDIFHRMEDALDGSTQKILSQLDKLAENGMPFATSLDRGPRAAREMEHLFAACVPQPVRVDPRASSSTVPAAPPATLDLAALEKLIVDIPPEPIGEWVREQGFPPETSLAILPETMRSQLPFWPSYVRFSLGVAEPMLARRPEVGHPAWMNGRRK